MSHNIQLLDSKAATDVTAYGSNATQKTHLLGDVLDLREDLLRGVPLPTLMSNGMTLFKVRNVRSSDVLQGYQRPLLRLHPHYTYYVCISTTLPHSEQG